MSSRTAARLGWSLFVLSGLLSVAALVMNLRRPQHSNLAFTTGEEEGGNSTGHELLWMLDPIDGTVNFGSSPASVGH